MAIGTVARQDVVAMLDDLPSDLLPEVVRFIQGLKPRARPARSAQEDSLVEAARKLIPADVERRLSALRVLQEEGRLSEEDRVELFSLIDRVEKYDAERAAAMIDLARLRGVPVKDVLQELAPEHVGDAG